MRNTPFQRQSSAYGPLSRKISKTLFQRFFLVIGFLLIPLFLGALGDHDTSEAVEVVSLPDAAEISYAEGFSIEYHEGWKILRVKMPWDNTEREFTYCLYPRGTERPDVACDLFVETPVKRIVVLSTTYLPCLDLVEEMDALVGLDNRFYVYSEEVLELVDQGRVREIGEHPNIDLETLTVLDPDIIMTPVYDTQGAWSRLSQAGFPVIINNDWLETTPLGRAEWIVFLAAFFDKEEAASDYMKAVAERYEELVALTQPREERPAVLMNTPWQGTWYVPAGESYQARLLRDAGAEYPWADTPGTGSLVLDFEEVYNTAEKAEIWLHTGSFRSKKEMEQDEERLALFQSFISGAVYNNDARLRSSGANDYWESAPLHPDLVLEDLVRIFHPDLLKTGEFHYYRRVE
ncbi:MAG: ABC transporter substrate-binding protein [Spirochaetales bacterium]|nr:ABC transporter substrate-binding protein [Spirochaetales bacterium]